MSMTPAVVVAGCALVFTVASFWWLNARQGRLKSWEPQSYAALWQPSVFFLQFPFVLYNTGAKPIVVQDLQLMWDKSDAAVLPLPWRRTVAELTPDTASDWLPAAFVVEGRAADQRVVEFGGPLPGATHEARDYRLRLQARLGHKSGWTDVMTFTWHARGMREPQQYQAYSNRVVEITDETRLKGQALTEGLVKRLTAQGSAEAEPPNPSRSQHD